jgi:hypothetical protein
MALSNKSFLYKWVIKYPQPNPFKIHIFALSRKNLFK